MKQKGKDRQKGEILQQEAQAIACKHSHRQFVVTQLFPSVVFAKSLHLEAE